MSRITLTLVLTAVSALMSGACHDAGMIGVSTAFGFIGLICFAAAMLQYLDSGGKMQDVDRARRAKRGW